MRLAGCLIAAVLVGGCATHRPPSRAGDSPRTVAAGQNTGPLAEFIEKVRQLSVAARPRPNDAATMERGDPELVALRLLLTASPTAEHHRRVAEAYARRGVLDAAYDHYAAAVRLDPRDGAAFDGLARVWRDWGFSHLGLTDAYRAIYYDPDSPAPRNTLGTLLLNLGHAADARKAFEQALARDPGAAYALNNLCYTALVQGDPTRAIDRCRGALQADPRLAAAHNNLALAFVASGDLAAASQEFTLAGDAATERYNMGVALLATRQFTDAALAFDEAAELRPSLTMARVRARQARTRGAQ